MVEFSKKYNFQLNNEIKKITDDFNYKPIHTV